MFSRGCRQRPTSTEAVQRWSSAVGALCVAAEQQGVPLHAPGKDTEGEVIVWWCRRHVSTICVFRVDRLSSLKAAPTFPRGTPAIAQPLAPPFMLMTSFTHITKLLRRPYYTPGHRTPSTRDRRPTRAPRALIARPTVETCSSNILSTLLRINLSPPRP